MQLIDGKPVFSATDLVGFLACEHLTTLERAVLHKMVDRPTREDAELDILRRRGIEHEARFLADLRRDGLVVGDGQHPNHGGHAGLGGQRLRDDARLTMERMREGVDVVYQATFFDGQWLGYADFLRRVDGASDLGTYHYEVVDTKLARRTKGGALLQMCVYSDLLTTVQGRPPEYMYVALGGSARTVDAHRLNDYLAYYRRVKDRFERHALDGAPPNYPLATTPVPVSHCEVCRWDAHCSRLRREADHLSLVAYLRGDQVPKLASVAVRTLTDLATLEPPLPRIERMTEATLDGLQAQASLQLRSRGLYAPLYEFLPHEARLGLGSLPLPSWGDLFFDMEGDPWAEEDGLEYLFGVIDPAEGDGDTPKFHAWWAHSRAEERAAFEGFIDFVMDRWRADPIMHVYHYASYERGRMGMLSTRHGTREEEVDKLLTADVFVDLFKVVRQGVRIGSHSYSIKRLEPLYALRREVPLKDAGSSIVAYENYIRSVTTGAADQGILDEIWAYNRDDCISNRDLRSWLETRRDELSDRLGSAVSRPGASDKTAESPPSDRDLRIEALAGRLLSEIPAGKRTPEQDGRWLLAHLLEWHRREEKVEWWEFFDRCSRSDEELHDDPQAIGQLAFVTEVDRGRSVVNRYQFDPDQPYRLKEGATPVNPRTRGSTGTIVALDPLHGTLDLKWQASRNLPHPTSLIPGGPITADEQKAAMERIGGWVADHGLDGPGPYRAARSLLLGRAPRVGQRDGSPLAMQGERPTDAATRLVVALDETVLPVQGPPGSGKTYAGAEMILALIGAGRQVGITAFTHKAIINLLDEVIEHARRSGVEVHAIRKLEQNEKPSEDGPYRTARDNGVVAAALVQREVQLAAGTAWMWAREEFEGLTDTLFVDEAGQMSLANVISVSGAARNVVLLGDPQQLTQVRKGAHPEGVDVSSLEYVLDGSRVIDPRCGLFLSETWRLHPRVNAFTSELFYESQLQSEQSAAQQALSAPGALSGTGVRWVPVEHHGNANDSVEEADVIVELYRDLLRGTWTDTEGGVASIAAEDILVVAPYNAQVELLTERLAPIAGAALRIGTVDRIQGQQAAVVIYSMATSSQEEMPRTMEFLFSLNRLNVATSRGRCMAVIVASPKLLEVSVHTPFQMRLANALCRFVELAEEQTPA